MTMENAIYDTEGALKIGAVITTHDALPFIHLHLESRLRFHPDTPLLIVAFAKSESLDALCLRYGVDVVYCEAKGTETGALLGIVKGFEWAEARGLDLLVRFSDSWVPLCSWHEGLANAACETQFATLSGGWATTTPRFSAEAMAFHPQSWIRFSGIQLLRENAELETSVEPDSIIYQSAADIFEHRCTANTEYCERRLEPLEFGCCGFWSISSAGTRTGALSKNWGAAHDYLRALHQWGIADYTLEQIELLLNPKTPEPAKP